MSKHRSAPTLDDVAKAAGVSTAAFAKAHDQGVADGEDPVFAPGEVAGLVDDVVRVGLEGALEGVEPQPGDNANAEARKAAKGNNGLAVGRGR